LLEAGDHIHIARKDTNLAVIKPPTGLAKQKKKKTKERIAGELQMQIQRRTHTPVIVHVAALPHGFFTPEFNTTAQEGGGGGGKKHRQRTRSSSEAIEALHRKRGRQTDRRSAPLPKKKKKRESSAASLSAASAPEVFL
jgi:hypothetical protein